MKRIKVGKRSRSIISLHRMAGSIRLQNRIYSVREHSGYGVQLLYCWSSLCLVSKVGEGDIRQRVMKIENGEGISCGFAVGIVCGSGDSCSNSLQSESVTSEDENVLVETDSAGPDDEIYVYDGETFYEDGVSPYARVAAGKINYTYWAIHGGADFGDILEDGRNLDHLGIIMLKTGKNWKTAYCIHHNANLQGGHNYADVESYLTDTEKKELTGLALYNGFKFDGWTPDDDTVPDDADKGKYTATQVMVWIIEKGWYTYDKNNCSFIIQSKAVSVAKTFCTKSEQSPSGGS